MPRTYPTQERVKELLDYNPLTGVFYWKVDRSPKKAGDVAGCASPARTYAIISIDGALYRAHHIAWLWMTGEWPRPFIDHKDLNKKNNAFDNLRVASKSQNQANIGPTKANKSGLKGVSRYRQGEAWGKPWQSAIVKDGKHYHVGHFATKEEAHEAYMVKARELYGEFARAA